MILDLSKVDRMILDGMWCGQGMAHLLRLYEPASEVVPAGLALFDFGSGGSNFRAATEALGVAPPVTSVINQLKIQRDAGLRPTLDLVLISHQDHDHWALIPALIEQVRAEGIDLLISKIIISGLLWGVPAKTVLKELSTFTANAETDVIPYDPNYSDYRNPPGPVGTTIPLGPVTVHTMIANCPSATKSEALIKNGTSAVVLVRLGMLSYILPGDATYETLAAINALLKKWAKSPLPFVYAMSAPHHGSLSTMTQSNIGIDSDLTELREFVALTRPYSDFASAGANSSHKHPHEVILRTINRHIGQLQYEAHDYVVYETQFGTWKTIEKTSYNCYTSIVNLIAPVTSADWLFECTRKTHATTARFFQAGIPAVISVPTVDSTMLASSSSGSYTMVHDDFDYAKLEPMEMSPRLQQRAQPQPARPVFDFAVRQPGRTALPPRRVKALSAAARA